MGNKYIKVAYKLYTIEDGERDFMEEAPAEEPFEFISGLGVTLEGFENKIKDLNIGEKFDFVIPQKEAYGEYDDTLVIELPKSVFSIDGKFDDIHVKVDAIVPLISADGERFSGVVQEIKGEAVVIDLNHPMAGCDLNFIGEVVETHEATPEEIEALSKPACEGNCANCAGNDCDCNKDGGECCGGKGCC